MESVVELTWGGGAGEDAMNASVRERRGGGLERQGGAGWRGSDHYKIVLSWQQRLVVESSSMETEVARMLRDVVVVTMSSSCMDWSPQSRA